MTALAMRQVGLKPASKIVLYWLADHHNSETGMCFPSLKMISKECEMDVATVKRHLDRLEQMGLIERHQRHRENGSQTSTQYLLRLADPLAQNAPPPSAKTHPPLAQKDTPLNLGINNLGTEQDISIPTVFEKYNEIADRAGWPKVQNASKARERAAAQRMKECGGFEHWVEAMERAAKSDFLLGKATGTTPASFDWLNAPKNFTKLMEGNYDKRNNNTRKSAQGRENGIDPALENIARLAGLR